MSGSVLKRSPVGAGLTILSWSIDASQRTMHGAQRRMPFLQRLPHLVTAIQSTNADVVCLQDSHPAIAEALLAAKYVPVGSGCVNGKHGWLQTFLRSNNGWEATSLPQFPFSTIRVTWQGESGKRLSTTVCNVDLSYRGKGLGVVGSGLNEAPFATPSASQHAVQIDDARRMARNYIADVIRPDVVVGNSLMGSSDTLSPLYQDVWLDVCGGPAKHDGTTHTLPPIAALSISLLEKGLNRVDELFDVTGFALGNASDYFYFSCPHIETSKLAMLLNRRSRNALAADMKLVAFLDTVDSSAAAAEVRSTAVSGRYQRMFLRRNSRALQSLFRSFDLVTLRPKTPQVVNSRVLCAASGDVLAANQPIRVDVGLSDQFPILVTMSCQ